MQLLRPRHAAELLGCARSTVYKFERIDPTFPKKRRLTPRLVGWYRHELEEWMERRAEDLEAQAGGDEAA
jgi:prophage regulatory protein